MQQKMLGVVFEGNVVSRYESYDIPNNGFKYIHYDLINVLKYLTITLIVGSTFVTTFSSCLNVGSYI